MKKILSISLILLIQSCAFYYHKPITNSFNNGKVKTNMTTEEVRKVLGNPSNIGTRRIGDETREVWRYNEYTPDGVLIALGILTLGISWLLPPKPSPQYLIFQNDKLVGINLPDPYAPDLIIEKRER